MHHSISFIMFTIIWFASNVLADNARFFVQVLDSVSGKPVKDAYVRGTFESRYPRWVNATEFSDFSTKTGEDGRLFFSGETNCGDAGFRIDKSEFHYGVSWIAIPYERKRKLSFTWWQPDNLVVTVLLQRVENPIPLFVKQLFCRGSDSVSSNYFDIGNGKMEFDLMKGSFLPPIGKGEYADICFTRLEREDLGIGTNFNGRTSLAYRDRMMVAFLGEGNGLVEISSKKTDGIKIRTAPLDGYKADYLVAKGKDRSVKYFTSSDPDRNFAFRIRTKKDADGKIVSAYYGKIYGDIDFKKLDFSLKVFVAAPSFLYYLNPKPLDRNLEWDMKNNFCPNPGSLSQSMP